MPRPLTTNSRDLQVTRVLSPRAAKNPASRSVLEFRRISNLDAFLSGSLCAGGLVRHPVAGGAGLPTTATGSCFVPDDTGAPAVLPPRRPHLPRRRAPAGGRLAPPLAAARAAAHRRREHGHVRLEAGGRRGLQDAPGARRRRGPPGGGRGGGGGDRRHRVGQVDGGAHAGEARRRRDRHGLAGPHGLRAGHRLLQGDRRGLQRRYPARGGRADRPQEAR